MENGHASAFAFAKKGYEVMEIDLHRWICIDGFAKRDLEELL